MILKQLKFGVDMDFFFKIWLNFSGSWAWFFCVCVCLGLGDMGFLNQP